MTLRTIPTIVLFGLHLVGCVGTNPDWDESRDRDSGTDSAPVDTHAVSSAGDSSAADSSTGDAADPPFEPATSTQGAAETGAVGDDTCLQQGLARCEDETMVLCADLTSDPNHCGACFQGCAAIAGSTCRDGACRCEDDEWWAVCDGTCRHVKSDPRNCGVACVDCTEIDGRDAECKNGVCESDD